MPAPLDETVLASSLSAITGRPLLLRKEPPDVGIDDGGNDTHLPSAKKGGF